jgi:hypothetical protein
VADAALIALGYPRLPDEDDARIDVHVELPDDRPTLTAL